MDSKPIKAKDEDVVTINLQPYATPISILLAAIIIASSILIGFNNLSKTGITTSNTTATTNTTGTTDTNTTAGTASSVTIDQVKALFDDKSNLSFGDTSKKVLFVEFSDPSCPYCHIAGGLDGPLNKSAGATFTLVADGGTYVAPVPEMKKMLDAGTAAYVWVYLNGHGNGEMGTKAMYCAQEKGAFWAVHDLLYSDAGYNELNNVVLNDKTKSAELANFLSSAVDKSFMQSCLESDKYASKLTTDISTAQTFGVTGTPGFFVNTTNFAGAYSYTDMKSAVDAALNS